MQPVVAKIAFGPSPSQPWVDIEITRKFNDDILSVLCIFGYILHTRHSACHQYSSIANSKLKLSESRSAFGPKVKHVL